MLVIDILDDAKFFQVGGSQTPFQGAVLFPKPLVINEQSKAFFEAELGDFGGFELRAEVLPLGDGLGYAVKV